MTLTLQPRVLMPLVCSAVFGFCGCAQTLEKLDSGWRVADPSGHHRYHRDRYYKHERKIGLRLPGDAGRYHEKRQVE